jgi:predicted Rossmann-fold nucleotide-binding protein
VTGRPRSVSRQWMMVAHPAEERHAPDDLLRAHLVGTTESAEEARAAFLALASIRKAVSIFGSARTAPTAAWGDLARETASAISAAGFAVITGGGPGLMAAANEAARSAGGTSIGLTIDLPTQEEPNTHLGLRVPFHYFFLRKLAFVKYS